MGDPQRSDAVESDRRSSPRFPADVLGKASVRLLGGSEVTLINFSERGLLFQSETRLLVGARGTVRIVVGTETTIAAGTVVRSLVQGMASGKLAFHTALALDQPLALAAAVAARERERIKAEARAPKPEPVELEPEPEPVELEPEPEPVEAPAPVADVPVPTGKTIEKRSPKKRAETPVETPEPPAEAPAPIPVPAPLEPAKPAAPVSSGFGDTGFDSGSWSDPAADPAAAGLSVLFVSTSKERTSRLQGILAGHRRDIVLTTVMHSKAETIAAIARQHDVLLFDFSIGPAAPERTLSALRTSPLGASVAVLVPQQTALPPAESSLANACVIETTSGDMLVAALRDAAWTPWQPVDGEDEADAPRPDLFWKAFDALPVPVLVVDDAGTILHANG
ncbi:MAG: PilZ domain-containing protein, partial [Vicinamibacteria bacterium]